MKVGIVGVGNCAAALAKGIEMNPSGLGLLYPDLGGYEPGDIELCIGFDVDRRKVTKPLRAALYQAPNLVPAPTRVIPLAKVHTKHVCGFVVQGPRLDGVADHMLGEEGFWPADEGSGLTMKRCVEKLNEVEAEVLLNYLPVGSEHAARFYADVALEAGCGFINCMPVLIASDPNYRSRFEVAGLPLIGDDVKSQFGATILHRMLTELMEARGVKVERTYQLNVGGNTDFLNMTDPTRLVTKRHSKTQAVQSTMREALPVRDIKIGPSDHIPWLEDNKICFIRVEGTGFDGSPVELDLRLSVQDSQNSAGEVVDAIRCMGIALDQHRGGLLPEISAWTMKHPPIQMIDHEAAAVVEKWIRNRQPNTASSKAILLDTRPPR